MFTVDTNLLVYAANADSMHHARANELVEKWRAGHETWRTGWNTLYEFLRVVTHPKVLTRPWPAAKAWHYTDELLASPSVRLMAETDRHRDIVQDLFVNLPQISGNLIHDLHTLALMKEHGIRTIYTCDSAFARFPNIKAINPLA